MNLAAAPIAVHDLFSDLVPPEALIDFFEQQFGLLENGAYLAISGLFALKPGGLPGILILDEFTSLAARCGFELVVRAENSSEVEVRLSSLLATESTTELRGEKAIRALGSLRGALLSRWAACCRLLLRRTEVRWRVAPMTPARFHDYAALFAVCFDSAVSEAFWRWKYRTGASCGVLVLEGGKPIAHYGGVIRPVMIHGCPGEALQPVDVMVAPHSRGVLTRRGAMFQAAAATFESYLGTAKRCSVIFGFPTRRHLALAEKLGLFFDCGPIEEWWWPIGGHADQRFALRDRLLTADEAVCWADACWPQMRDDLVDAVCAVRDGAWLKYRYVEHPEKEYGFIGVFNRLGWWRRIGLAVVRKCEEGCELVDLVGGLAAVPDLVRAARRYAAAHGCGRLFVWVTGRYGALFARAGACRGQVEIRNAMISHCAVISPERLYDQWWLMGGDSDFR